MRWPSQPILTGKNAQTAVVIGELLSNKRWHYPFKMIRSNHLIALMTRTAYFNQLPVLPTYLLKFTVQLKLNDSEHNLANPTVKKRNGFLQ